MARRNIFLSIYVRENGRRKSFVIWIMCISWVRGVLSINSLRGRVIADAMTTIFIFAVLWSLCSYGWEVILINDKEAKDLQDKFNQCRTAEDLKNLSRSVLQQIEPGVTHEVRCIAPPTIKTECNECRGSIPSVATCGLPWAECAFQAIGQALMSREEAFARGIIPLKKV